MSVYDLTRTLQYLELFFGGGIVFCLLFRLFDTYVRTSQYTLMFTFFTNSNESRYLLVKIPVYHVI